MKNIPFFLEWVKELKSGKWEQCRGKLGIPDTNKRCCLGIASELIGATKTITDDGEDIIYSYKDEENTSVLPLTLALFRSVDDGLLLKKMNLLLISRVKL